MKYLAALVLIPLSILSCKKENKSSKSEFINNNEAIISTKGKIETGNWLDLEYQLIEDSIADTRFASIQALPQFPGGYDSLANFIKGTFDYPDTAIKDSVEGRNKSTFIVDETGKVIDVKIIQELREDLDSETYRVLSNIPDWQPAELSNGHKVKVLFSLPIKFMMRDGDN